MAELRKPQDSTIELIISWLGKVMLKKFRNVYYSARESIGDHKRDIVVYQVEHACTGLQETRDEFETALERFKTLINVHDTTLEHRYNQLNRQYQFCKAKSDAVSDRISAIEQVSEALFNEWERELEEYSNTALRNRSKQQLKLTRQNYARLIKSMRKAESKILPVLAVFKDQVLYLKHNLNAQAIAALQSEFVAIGIDISQLIQAMEHTIAEASLFVSALVEQKALPKA
jgi:hypothetical protein